MFAANGGLIMSTQERRTRSDELWRKINKIIDDLKDSNDKIIERISHLSLAKQLHQLESCLTKQNEQWARVGELWVKKRTMNDNSFLRDDERQYDDHRKFHNKRVGFLEDKIHELKEILEQQYVPGNPSTEFVAFASVPPSNITKDDQILQGHIPITDIDNSHVWQTCVLNGFAFATPINLTGNALVQLMDWSIENERFF